MNTNTNRTYGYYWIFLWDEWQVAKWADRSGDIDGTNQNGKDGDAWFLCGIEFFPDYDFHMIKEINETKIVISG